MLGRADGAALGRQGQVAVQGHAVDRLPPAGGSDGPAAGLDLPQARQEHQHGFALAPLLEPVLLESAHHLLLQPLIGPGRLVADRHRVAAALAAEHGGPRELLGQGGQVEGGRHHHQPQIRPEQFAGLAHQGQGQVGVGPPFMEFIEDQAVHPSEAGIGLEAPEEQPVGEHLQPGCRRGARLQPNAVTNPLAHRFAELGSQSLGRRFGRQPAGLQHPDPADGARADAAGWGLQQGKGYSGCFARPRRGLQQHRGPGFTGLEQRLQEPVNRQGSGCRGWDQRT